MLPLPLRYPLRQDSAFFDRAKAFRSPFFTILAAPISAELEKSLEPSPLPRFAIIVKKMAAKGVERTQIKRIIRAAIIEATSSPLPDFDHSYAVVVIPRRKALTTPVAVLATELREALLQLEARPLAPTPDQGQA